MPYNSRNEGSSLKEILPIALTAWGAYYVLSGLKTLGIKAMLQTALGGWMVYRGMQGFSDYDADNRGELLFDEDSDPYIEETDVIVISEDPTLE